MKPLDTFHVPNELLHLIEKYFSYRRLRRILLSSTIRTRSDDSTEPRVPIDARSNEPPGPMGIVVEELDVLGTGSGCGEWICSAAWADDMMPLYERVYSFMTASGRDTRRLSIAMSLSGYSVCRRVFCVPCRPGRTGRVTVSDSLTVCCFAASALGKVAF